MATELNRRSIIGIAAGISLAGLAAANPAKHTSVAIRGRDFFLDSKPSFAGRSFGGHSIQGLLFTSRMANAIVDDRNPQTRGVWEYPDGPWDPERNTREFIAALPFYHAYGLNSVAINLQGGNPQGYGWHQPWQLSGFDETGRMLADYRRRLEAVLAATNALGMVTILGILYIGAKPALRDEAAVIQAVDDVTDLLCAGRHTNVLIEIGNEIDLPGWKHDIVKPGRCRELIARVQQRSAGRLPGPAGRLLVSTSFTIRNTPPDDVLAALDYVLLHGNGCETPAQLCDVIRRAKASRAYRGQPLLINEDDHYDFDKPENNFVTAIAENCGWGFFDYRREREKYADGYQSLPVDWGINSTRKKDFFALLKQVTSGGPSANG
jgi:hypothetical protein